MDPSKGFWKFELNGDEVNNSFNGERANIFQNQFLEGCLDCRYLVDK